DTRSVDEFRLVGNIDFSKQLNGQDRYIIDFSKNENDMDRKFTYSGNYADPNGKKEEIEGVSDNDIIKTLSFYGDSMIVGSGGFDGLSNPFVANFNGNGHTLSNIDIDMDEQHVSNHMLGVFGVIGEIIGDYNRSVTIQNLIVDTININSNNRYINSGSGIHGGTHAGGLVGYIGGIAVNPNLGLINFENIVVSNVEIVSKNGYSPVYLGGFAGNISVGSVSNIFVNNVKGIKATTHGNGSSFSVNLGGFAGHLYVVKGAKNIVLNGMGNITNEYDSWNSMGGFVGLSRGNLSNIYVYFKPNSVFVAPHNSYARGDIGIFGKFDNSWTLDNVNLYYNFDTTDPNSIANLPHSEDYYNQTLNPSIPAQDKINLYTYTNSTNKRDEFNAKIKQTFGDNIVILGNDIEGWNYHFNPPLNNPILPTLDMDNLFNKGGYFDSSSWLTKDSFNQSILNEILENLSFDILSLITDTNSLESALQSLDFLLHFINADKSGESGISLGNGIYGLMGYTLNQSQIDLLNSNNLLITQKLISSINSLSLEDKHYIQEYKQKLESYQAKAKEFEESLKVISSDKHQALIEAFKQENGYYSLLDDRDRAEKIIKTAINNNGEFNLNNPYKIANGINVSFNLNTIEGINDKDGLNPDFTLPSANSSLFVKEDIEDVLILPAQEKQEAIVEDGKERGRLCIVSDNAKTNNPCMAITY
ncbi:hypothetical protein, partial [Helicobacter pullorum]|uniref:hypothetical protein n=1 Tax=Helicobacter pullorum TaxID=35818 RepID=UPI0006CCE6A4